MPTISYSMYARGTFYFLGTVDVDVELGVDTDETAMTKAVEMLHGVSALDLVLIPTG